MATALFTHPQEAERFLKLAPQEVTHRYNYYKQLSELEWDDDTSVAATKARLSSKKPES